MKINIFGINVDNCSLDEIIKIIIDRAVAGVVPEYVVIPNNRHRIALSETGQNSLYEIELLANLCAEAANRGLKVFFLGDSLSATQLATTTLQQQHPYLQISFYCPTSGFETDSIELATITRTIKNASPHLLLVKTNTPKQQQWLEANYQHLGVPVSLSIGISFKLIAEVVRGTPMWVQQTGLEWLYYKLINN
ncbi:MAG: WecB/TagA/CpsF family glycosyltransferase [Pleurocapsa sp.]